MVDVSSHLGSLVHLDVSMFVEVLRDARDDSLTRVITVTQHNHQTLVLKNIRSVNRIEEKLHRLVLITIHQSVIEAIPLSV